MTKEELKKKIAEYDGIIYSWDLTGANIHEFKTIVNERNKLEQKLKMLDNVSPSVNILSQPIIS